MSHVERPGQGGFEGTPRFFLSISLASPEESHPATLFPFTRLLPELRAEVLRVGSLCTRICLGLTCRELFNHPNRPTVSLNTFVRAICEEGAQGLLPFVLSLERTFLQPVTLLNPKDLAVAAERDHRALLLVVVDYLLVQHPQQVERLDDAVQAAARHGHLELLQAIKERFKDRKWPFEDAEHRGVLESGDVQAALKLQRPDDPRHNRRVLLLAPLPVVQALFNYPQAFADERLAEWAAQSSDPRVLPWCHAQGLAFNEGAVDYAMLIRLAVRHDRLENLLLLLKQDPTVSMSMILSEAFSSSAQRVLRHFLQPGQPLPCPLQDFVHWPSFFGRHPYWHSLQLLADTGLIEHLPSLQLSWDPFPMPPELAYLELRVKLFAWDPAQDEDCLLNLVAYGWTPETERCALWLVHHGARMSARFFARVAEPAYRASFLQKLLARGCPTSPEAYLALGHGKDAAQADRYWFLRSVGIPVPPLGRLFLAWDLTTRAPPEILKDAIEQQVPPLPPDYFDRLLAGELSDDEEEDVELDEVLSD